MQSELWYAYYRKKGLIGEPKSTNSNQSSNFYNSFRFFWRREEDILLKINNKIGKRIKIYKKDLFTSRYNSFYFFWKREEEIFERQKELKLPEGGFGLIYYDQAIIGANNYETELIKTYSEVDETEPDPNAERYSNDFMNWWLEIEVKRTRSYSVSVTD